MKYAADKNNLGSSDVKLMGQHHTTLEVKKYLDNNMNKTWYGVVFCTSRWDDGVTSNITIPCVADNHEPDIEPIDLKFYAILYNFTLMPSNFLQNWTAPALPDPNMLRIKNSIDSGIYDYLIKKKNKDENLGLTFNEGSDVFDEDPTLHIDVTWSNFPLTASRVFKNADITSIAGSFYAALGPLVSFVVILTEIVKEKQLKLRQGLSVVGLSHTAYWLHWILTGMFFAAIVSLASILIGLAVQFQLFFKANFFILFFLFFIFTFSLICWAFMMSTICSTQRMAYTASYAFVLLCIVILLMVSNPLMLYFIFFNNRSGTYMIFVRAAYYFLPPFTFSLIFGIVVRRATSHFDDNGQQFVEGTGFTWRHLFESEKGEFSMGDTYESPTPILAFGIFMIDIALYGLIVWYCDHVFSSNRGTNEPFYFFLTQNYWESLCCKKKYKLRRKKAKHQNMKESLEFEGTFGSEDSINNEKMKVINDMKEDVFCEGMRVINLKKTYRKYPCGIKSKKDTYANKGIYLDMSEKELLCILGHNGAGKSTMIGVLTGIFAPTSGTATLGGYDIVEEIDEVRQIIGVVPQFDILWDQLTAEEHMRMFCKIKGVPDSDIETVIDEKLAAVNLKDVKKARTCTFSGGMKRRLTVAISCIGDPKIVFMDEPTTGMDPVSRRQVWSLIQDLKSKRYVVLTTHSMEEADVLGDRIAVIVDGEFKCIGTPLYLKNNYGDGYRITLVTDPTKVNRAIRLMSMIVPTAKLLDESGGSIVFCVPINNIKDIIPILKLIEKEEGTMKASIDDPKLAELRSIVTDCGLSQTTLEEVFMIVTGKKEAKAKKTIVAENYRTSSSLSDSYSPKKFEEVKGIDEEVTYYSNPSYSDKSPKRMK